LSGKNSLLHKYKIIDKISLLHKCRIVSVCHYYNTSIGHTFTIELLVKTHYYTNIELLIKFHYYISVELLVYITIILLEL